LLAGGAYFTSQDPPKPLLQLTTATILGGMMSYRYYNSGKIMPAGVVALCSIIVIVRDLIVFNRYLPFVSKEQ
jgi:Transmembrane proteins 14C